MKSISELLKQLSEIIEQETLPRKNIDGKILQGFVEDKSDVKEAILDNLHEYFKKFKFLKDLKIIGSRLQFKIPKDKWDWITQWEETSKALKNGDLKLFKYNCKEGFLIEIQ